LAGLILGAVIAVTFSYSVSNQDINTAVAQNLPTKKVLIVTTSHSVLGNSGYPTGVWLPEMTHPFSALQNAGFNITVASIKGAMFQLIRIVFLQTHKVQTEMILLQKNSYTHQLTSQ
jgi:hypothetical protein